MGEDLEIYEKICTGRFERIEKKLDSIENKLDHRLTRLEDFQGKALGVIVVISVVAPILFQYLTK